MKHTNSYKWSYDRTNSSGEKIFKHRTEENLSDIMDYLNNIGVEYSVVDQGGMLWIVNKVGDLYSYYWTTGRWSSEKDNREKHYHAKGIKDLLDRFINNDEFLDRQNKFYFEIIVASEKTAAEIKDLILDEIITAGPEGIIAKVIKEKYYPLYKERHWGVINGTPAHLEREGLIFYQGDKINRSRIIRHISYKRNK